MFKVILIVIGIITFSYGAYTPIKAELSQYLIRHAWHESMQLGQTVKPWSWADMYPVMRLESVKHKQDLIVLAGDTGNVLAFGPGLSHQTPPNRYSSTWLVSAHRDTHFNFLQNIKIGEILTTTTLDQNQLIFKVSDIEIIDASKQGIDISDTQAELKLVTCYPFDTLTAGGSLRYVVTAENLSIENYDNFLY